MDGRDGGGGDSWVGSGKERVTGQIRLCLTRLYWDEPSGVRRGVEGGGVVWLRWDHCMASEHFERVGVVCVCSGHCGEE